MTKILILRFSSIGDIVLTTPVVRCIKKQLNAEIHYLTKPGYAGILHNNPYIDQVHILDKHPAFKAAALKKERFDYIVDLHHNLRTLVFKMVADGVTYSFPKLNKEKWVQVNFKRFFPPGRLMVMPPVHVVDRYFAAAAPLGVSNDGEGLDYFIPPAVKLSAKEFLPSSFGKFITWAIGGQHFTKRLPAEKIINTCLQLNVPVYLLGDSSDAAAAEQISKAAGGHVISLCGMLSLDQSAAIIAQSSLLLTNDTGLMHIGAALKKPIISFWGNTIPEFGMYPYYGSRVVRNKIFEIDPLYCRPCTKIGYEQCPQKHFKCMRMINEKQVAAAVINLLA
jgi:ADP-heptose:LPS heptosyltransferase